MSKGIVFRNKNNEKVYPCPYFPVGSIYMSLSNVNPSTYFGGTWAQIKDRFLLGAGSSYSAGSTGGEASHKLTINEMPSHSHSFFSGRWYWSERSGGGDIINSQSETSYGFNRSTELSGGNQAHNNMPPYYVVYIWRRTA
jgi:hypothetical protein